MSYFGMGSLGNSIIISEFRNFLALGDVVGISKAFLLLIQQCITRDRLTGGIIY